jgi:hypothetical protein
VGEWLKSPWLDQNQKGAFVSKVHVQQNKDGSVTITFSGGGAISTEVDDNGDDEAESYTVETIDDINDFAELKRIATEVYDIDPTGKKSAGLKKAIKAAIEAAEGDTDDDEDVDDDDWDDEDEEWGDEEPEEDDEEEDEDEEDDDDEDEEEDDWDDEPEPPKRAARKTTKKAPAKKAPAKRGSAAKKAAPKRAAKKASGSRKTASRRR